MGSTPPVTFNLRAWGAWSAEDPPGESDRAGSGDAHPAPALLRRRVGILGQHALRLAWGMPCSGEARLIVSSRHGEFRRSLGILDAIIAGADVSPAEFTLSVHHALVGLLSIARGNCRGHTAIAAGPESFCFGFMEAAACLAENAAEPVLLIHYDEPLPEPFDRPPGPALALVVALAATGLAFAFIFAGGGLLAATFLPALLLPGDPRERAQRVIRTTFRDHLATLQGIRLLRLETGWPGAAAAL